MISTTPRHLAALALAAVLAAGTAAAQTVELKADHPERYVVQKGDTLWDISGRFLAEPWLWPEVWEANPHIRNPHLIYPGDEIRLSYRDGQPILTVRRGGRAGRGGTVKLSPRVRSVPLDTAIPTIEVDVIQQFLTRPRVVNPGELEAAPYVVAVGRESLFGRPGEVFFARGLPADGHKRYAVYRQGREYVNPEPVVLATKYGVRVNRQGLRNREVLGVEALYVGDALLSEDGDPATMLLTRVERELLVGDRLVPVTEDEPYQHFFPRAVPDGFEGQIIAMLDGVTQIGELNVVVVNRGTADGVEVGHVMGVYQTGETIVDPYAKEPPGRQYPDRIELDPDKQGGPDGWGIAANDAVYDAQDTLLRWWSRINPRPQPWQQVELPPQRAGTVMIFRLFDRVSYGLVVEARGAMHIADQVAAP